MTYLVDTSLLLRLANTQDDAHLTARNAVALLHRQGELLQIAPQNLIEFRSVATRPAAVNGLGLTPAQAELQAASFEMLFPVLPETPEIYLAWKGLVQAAGAVGKQVHDARLAAVCQVHTISHILTFNTGHFLRLAAFIPGLIVIDPAALANSVPGNGNPVD